MGINEKLTDEELKGISGGAGKAIDPKLEKERKAFEDAWDKLDMEKKGYTGMQRAELYDQWQEKKSTIATPEAFLGSMLS
jgi:hypothetical protein